MAILKSKDAGDYVDVMLASICVTIEGTVYMEVVGDGITSGGLE